MSRGGFLFLFLTVLLHNTAGWAQSPPLTYRAITTRAPLPEPALPPLGAAGYLFRDPVFNTRILRVTDTATRPSLPNASFTTPSAAHQLAWNATSTMFWVRSVDGTIIPFTFDPVAMTARRIQPTAAGDGGFTIISQVEPQFSFVDPNTLYGSIQDSVDDWPIVRRLDFSTRTYTDVLNLGTVTTVNHATYAGALSSSATVPEKISVMFGGQQDSHYKVAVFNVDAPSGSAVVLDTFSSTITRQGVVANTAAQLGFFLHHAWIDMSGRYVVLTPTAAIPAPYVIWDTAIDTFTFVTTRAEGHEAAGFGVLLNQSCCTSSTYDGAQWQRRSLPSPNTTTDLIKPVQTPQEIYIADHTSWNNARPLEDVPVLSALYRYSDGNLNTTPWRAWDNELVAIQTGAGSAGATVWRFAHHRSDVKYESSGPNQPDVYFWYLPRPNVSPDGRWAIFTSNWEKSLGNSATPEPGGQYRCDVFLIALAKGGINTFSDDPLIPGETFVKPVHLLELRSHIDAQRTRFGLPPYAWTDAQLSSGMFIKAVHVEELRAALLDAYVAASRPLPTFLDPTLTPRVTAIKAAHIQGLRDAVNDLENR